MIHSHAVIHPSDCSIHEHAECDCGGLDLASYSPEAFVPTLVSSAGRVGFFLGEDSTACFIEPEQLPPGTLAAIAAAANLPDAHRIIASAGDPDSVDFHDAREAIVAQLKAHLLAQGLTSLRFPHSAFLPKPL